MNSEYNFDHPTHNEPENLSITRDAVWLGAMLLGGAGLEFWQIL